VADEVYNHFIKFPVIDKRDSISGGVVTDRTTTHARVYKRMSGEAFIDEWFAVSARSVSVQKAN
jgi:hypothetical protein